MVVDDKTAFVKSLNWQSENLTETRDYAIITSEPHKVAEIINCSKQMGPPGFRFRERSSTDLVPRQWPGTDYRVH